MTSVLQKMARAKQLRYYDIGFNITDQMFQGKYHHKQCHDCDIPQVLERCRLANVENVMITGSSIEESREAIGLCERFRDEGQGPKLLYTVGVHPCSVNEFVPSHAHSFHSGDDDGVGDEAPAQNMPFTLVDLQYSERKMQELYELIEARAKSDGMFRAIGEIGLDYDRLHYSSKGIQIKFFEEQLKLSCFFPEYPLFLHMRSCSEDFVKILNTFIHGFYDDKDELKFRKFVKSDDSDGKPIAGAKGLWYKFSPTRKFVVHSFTGTTGDLESLLACSPNCYFSVNGCSMKSVENVEAIKLIPTSKLLLETDAPWCDIRKSHESYKYLNSTGDPTIRDAWNNGLSDAYPQLGQWFSSVKKENLANKPSSTWNEYMVKSRNEPCTMGHVATAVANIKKMPLLDLVDQVWENSCNVYGN